MKYITKSTMSKSMNVAINHIKKNKIMYASAIVIIAFMTLCIMLLCSRPENFSTGANREIIFFKMNGCGHCERTKPHWEQIVKNFGDIDEEKLKFTTYTVDSSPEMADKYNVNSFPTFIYLKNNKEMKRDSGFKNYEALKKFVGNARTT